MSHDKSVILISGQPNNVKLGKLGAALYTVLVWGLNRAWALGVVSRGTRRRTDGQPKGRKYRLEWSM